jgi:UDP-N-acetylglucosamine 2-epimerase (non-hydrolysing)
MKVMTIVGTRPEIIKLCRVIAELDRHMEHILVHTGQNYDYELNGIFFDQLAIRKPNHFLEAAGGTAAETVGQVIARTDALLAQERPQALLILGDTNSCLAAYPAKRRKIPVFHLEAGNRCFDDRVPEEINRRLIDHLSDINLTYTEHARRYLLAEGLRPEMVIKTGSPMKEVLTYYRPQIEAADILARLKLAPDNYFVVSAHREENIDSEVNFPALLATLKAIAAKWDLPVIVSTHPRTRKRLESAGQEKVHPQIVFLPPLGFPDYIKLQENARCVISDSGTITEESSLLGFPAVMIREAHERPEGMDEGVVIMCGLKADRVLAAIEVTLGQKRRGGRILRIVPDYDVDNVSLKVVRIIMSYTDYVNRVVWHK